MSSTSTARCSPHSTTAASCNYALRTNGMEEHSVDDVRRFVGNGVRKLMERAIPQGDSNPLFDKTYADFRKHYMEHNLDTTKPYPASWIC